MRLFDTHCHIDEARFDADREDVHRRMAEAGVERFAVIGTSLDDAPHVMAYAAAHEGAIAVIGLYPEYADQVNDASLARLAELCREETVHAVGEIGLDWYWTDYPAREGQIAACEAQIRLAHELDLPCAFHVREAHADMLPLLKRCRPYLTGGIMHCFSGSWEIAKEYLKLGYHISLAGPVTFKNARGLLEVAANVPLDRLLVETDSPYLAPVPHRGQRNEPAYVRLVCERIAELRGMDAGELAEITYQNALRVYRVGERA